MNTFKVVMVLLLVLMTWSVVQVRPLQISQCGKAPCVRGHPDLQNIRKRYVVKHNLITEVYLMTM